MTPLTTIRKKLALLRRSPTKELLYDTLRAYVIEKGDTIISVDDLMLTVDKIAKELESRYSSVVVRKGPKTKKVVNRDLEELIDSVKSGKEDGK